MSCSSSIEMGSQPGCSPMGSARIHNYDLHPAACPQCAALRGKLATLCSHLQLSMGRHAFDEAIAHAGLAEEVKLVRKKSRKEPAFDRLYADAQRRDGRIRLN